MTAPKSPFKTADIIRYIPAPLPDGYTERYANGFMKVRYMSPQEIEDTYGPIPDSLAGRPRA